jgi:thiamine biosynthesis lipoprotein
VFILTLKAKSHRNPPTDYGNYPGAALLGRVMFSHLMESNIEVRRRRPLLGTFVEITVSGQDERKLNSAVDTAFAAIERIQNLVSTHDPKSELSLLNREATHRPVKVSRETYTILRRADRLAAESRGAFDYTIAPTLANWGLRPRALKNKNTCCWREVMLLPGRHVQFLSPLSLDLGGIAKGFAVDAAIEALRDADIDAAIVNAGGDLRVFGPKASTIHLRHPASSTKSTSAIQVKNSALATSSPCFTEKTWRGSRVSDLVDAVRQKAITGAVSVSVRARECWIADALTKVVLTAPELAKTLLAKYRAEAFTLGA